MHRTTDPARRLVLSVLLALLPTALMLWLLSSVLRPVEEPDSVPVIAATLIPDEQPPPPPIAEEFPEALLPPDPAPAATPSATPEPKPVPTVVSVTPQPEPQQETAGDANTELPAVDWWQAMDQFFDHRNKPDQENYAQLLPAPPVPAALPPERAFGPNEGYYNSVGEFVYDVSENCRAEHRDPVPNDDFVPPPLIFCKRPPTLALPLRRPRYLDNEITNDKESGELTRYAFGFGQDTLKQ